MKLRIALAKPGHVRFISALVEPLKHPIDLFADQHARQRHGKPLELDRPPQDASENFGGLVIRQCATRDLQFHADEFLGTLKGQRHETADVIGGDHLIFLVAPYRRPVDAFENSEFDYVEIKIVKKSGWPKNRGRQTELENVLLDLSFALPDVDARVAVSTADRIVNKMGHARFQRRIRQV